MMMIGGGMVMEILDKYEYEMSLFSAAAFLVLLFYLFYLVTVISVSLVVGLVAATTGTSNGGCIKKTPAQQQPQVSSSSFSLFRMMTNIALLAIAIELPFLLQPTKNDNNNSNNNNSNFGDGLADLIRGTDPRLQEILDRAPSIQQGPLPPLFFRNRHVQFLPWLIQNEIHRVWQEIPFQRVHVNVASDCALDIGVHANVVSDCAAAATTATSTMHDTITLDIFPPFDHHYDDKSNNDPYFSPFSKGFNRTSPIILFSPGLRCYSQDMPGNMIIRKAYAAGFRSIVVHRRGHTPDQPLKSPRWNLFGDVNDLEQVYWFVKNKLVAAAATNSNSNNNQTDSSFANYTTSTHDNDHTTTKDNTPMFLHGISSGTAVTVTALSKWDKRRVLYPDRPVPVFVASIAVTPGYDISRVMGRERFLFPYHDMLLPGVKDHFVRKNEHILRRHDSAAVDKALAATSLQEFVDATVVFAGYENTTMYYQDTNPINDLVDITTPKLVLNSMDDPCCKIGNLYERSPQEQHGNKTFAQLIQESERAIVAVTRTGSHCPFLCTRGKWLPFTRDPLLSSSNSNKKNRNGGWMLNSWADQVSIEFYQAALEVYGDRRFL